MVEVGSPEFIAGYILTFINYICYCSSRFVKTKRMMLILDLTSKVLLTMGAFCLGSFSGAVSMVIMMICLICSVYKENHRESFGLAKSWVVFLILSALHCSILFFMYQGISTILVVTTNIIGLITIWWLRPQAMRLVGAANSVIFMFYQFSIRNLVGLLEIFVFASNMASYIKYLKKGKKEGLEEAKQKVVYNDEDK